MTAQPIMWAVVSTVNNPDVYLRWLQAEGHDEEAQLLRDGMLPGEVVAEMHTEQVVAYAQLAVMPEIPGAHWHVEPRRVTFDPPDTSPTEPTKE